MSTIKVDNLQTTGGAGLYPAKAWVNFDGTGTVAIRADDNVSSITDGGTGNYTVNFTTAMADTNYATLATCATNGPSAPSANTFNGRTATLAGSVLILVNYANRFGEGYFDFDDVSVSIFR